MQVWPNPKGLLWCSWWVDGKPLQRSNCWGKKQRMEALSQTAGSHKSTWRLCCPFLKIIWSAPAWSCKGWKIGAMKKHALLFESWISYPKQILLQAKPHGKTSSKTSHRSSFISLPILSMWQPSPDMLLESARFFSPWYTTLKVSLNFNQKDKVISES